MSIISTFKLVSRALKASGIPHALAGGMATNLIVPSEDMRETHDVDFALATIYPDPAAAVIAYLFERGYFDVEPLLTSRVSKTPHQPPYADILKIVVGGVRVDLVVLRNKKYVATAMQRVWVVKFAGSRCTILSPEDLFIYKAMAGRPKDIQPMSALSQMPRFNWKYTLKWSRLLGVGKLALKLRGFKNV